MILERVAKSTRRISPGRRKITGEPPQNPHRESIENGHTVRMREFIDDPGLRAGLAVGLTGVALLGTLSAVLASRLRQAPFPLAGLAVGLGAVVVSAFAPDDRAIPGFVVQALVLAAIGGLLATLGRFPAPLVAVAYAPAAIRLAVGPSIEGAPTWSRYAAALVAAAGGALLADFDRRRRPAGLTLPLFVVAVGGAYSTLPDTENVLVLLGVVLPFAAIAVPRAWEAVGSAGAGVLCTWYGWVVWIDGRGRAGAVVGAVAALGVLIAEPIAQRLGAASLAHVGAAARLGSLAVLGLAVALQVVVSLAAGRIAGLRTDAASAAALAVPILVVAGLAGAAIPRPPRPQPRHPEERWRDDRYRR